MWGRRFIASKAAVFRGSRRAFFGSCFGRGFITEPFLRSGQDDTPFLVSATQHCAWFLEVRPNGVCFLSLY